MDQKGQTALEVLIIMGVLILAVIIFALYYTNHVSTNVKESGETSEGVDKLVDDFITEVDNTADCNNGNCGA